MATPSVRPAATYGTKSKQGVHVLREYRSGDVADLVDIVIDTINKELM